MSVAPTPSEPDVLEPESTRVPSQVRAWVLFFVVCAVGALAVIAYVRLWPAGANATTTAASEHVEPVSSVPDGPFILFRDTSAGEAFGRLAIRQLPLAGDRRLVASLSCQRVHYAAGSGVCMVADERTLPIRYIAHVFDRAFQTRHEVALTGQPIRARVAPDGRRAALTVFERGHSYADEDFSTRTIVIDTATGKSILDLEELTVKKDGAPFKSVDFNFWGLTFAADADRFYATLKTRGQRYLVRGSVGAREASVVGDGVECPSLSPDGRLIAYKKPLERTIGWRLYVRDLESGAEHPLNQVRRSVDDQVDWLDAEHVVYHDSASEGTGIWAWSIDGVSPPQLIGSNAYSPSVQR